VNRANQPGTSAEYAEASANGAARVQRRSGTARQQQRVGAVCAFHHHLPTQIGVCEGDDRRCAQFPAPLAPAEVQKVLKRTHERFAHGPDSVAHTQRRVSNNPRRVAVETRGDLLRGCRAAPVALRSPVHVCVYLGHALPKAAYGRGGAALRCAPFIRPSVMSIRSRDSFAKRTATSLRANCARAPHLPHVIWLSLCVVFGASPSRSLSVRLSGAAVFVERRSDQFQFHV
jgi:hypothetical protein